MKVAIYPGSFNPWHEGHTDVLHKALAMFDRVIIGIGNNPQKQVVDRSEIWSDAVDSVGAEDSHRVSALVFRGLLVDFIKELEANGHNVVAIVRGLRNGQDFEMEKIQQYHNEDLGLELPTVYFISDRSLVHVSSSAIRAIEKARDNR